MAIRYRCGLLLPVDDRNEALTNAEYQYQMGYTEVEFSKVLKGDFSGPRSPYRCFDEGPLHWKLEHLSDPFKARVSIQQGSSRQLGALQLPVLKVNFKISAASEELQTAFFNRFFMYFHKGGG